MNFMRSAFFLDISVIAFLILILFFGCSGNPGDSAFKDFDVRYILQEPFEPFVTETHHLCFVSFPLS